jgi:hypothetical protein
MNATNSFGFDGTILNYPYHYTNKITFIKKNIGDVTDDQHTNLSRFTNKYNNIFLKMDIEGGEYPWLLQLKESELRKFKQIVMEVHGITNDGFNCPLDDKIKCLEKLSRTHYLVHAHGNNHSIVVNNIPNVMELTYVGKKYFDFIPKLNKVPLPIKDFDFPNRRDREDNNLNFYPFTT